MTRHLLSALAVLALLGCAAPTPPPEPFTGRPGPLTVHTRRHWPGDVLPWRAAAVDLLIDPANPLGLEPAESERVARLFQEYIDGEDHYGFRLGELYGLLHARWRSRSEVDYRPHQVVEEQFLADAAAARRILQAQSGGRRAEPVPYPDMHLGQTPPPGGVIPPLDRATPAWEAAIPPDRQLALGQVGHVLREAVPGLGPEDSARAAAELREAERQVRRMRDAWLALEVLLARHGRAARVAERARRLGPGGDWEQVSLRLGSWAAARANASAAAGASPSSGPPR